MDEKPRMHRSRDSVLRSRSVTPKIVLQKSHCFLHCFKLAPVYVLGIEALLVKAFPNGHQNTYQATTSKPAPGSAIPSSMNSESNERLNIANDMESFSATRRPFKQADKNEKNARGWNASATAEAWGNGAPNLLPTKFTDESLIDIPVMRPEDIGKAGVPKKKSLFGSRRRSENTNFIIRQMPRGEYLKYYAKDDNGRYCGTEEPAKDCILRGEDVQKYRGY